MHVLQALRENRDVFDISLAHQTDRISNCCKESDVLLRRTGQEIKDSIAAVSEKVEYTHRKDAPEHNREWLEDKYAIPAILESLKFPGMEERYDIVVEAHTKTFSWIFEPDCPEQPWDSFTSWLENTDPIYWIKGKAASGKSTLVRSIYEHPNLRKHLAVWTGGGAFITPKFYFWSTGTIIQKSQIGLFCSLLYPMFAEHKSMMREILPDLVRDTAALPFEKLSKLRGTWRNWPLVLLKRCLLSLIRQTTTKYCFFIDGLDEFDGDHLDLTSFLKAIAEYPNVKLCLSSRPLMAFEQQLGACPKLQLQDLTKGDITRFVHDILLDHPQFCSLAQNEPNGSAHLINRIVESSSGVFLWVSLVVKSLLKGLTNHDKLSDLERRLGELPPELEGLYSHMLSSISPPFYMEQASRLLQMVYQTPTPIIAAELSFADDLNEELPFITRIGTIQPDELKRRTEDMIPRLKSRCAGLLEVLCGTEGTKDPRHWCVCKEHPHAQYSYRMIVAHCTDCMFTI